MLLIPADWAGYSPVVIYVDEWGKEAGLANGIVQALLSAEIGVFAIDVRGVGETATSDFEAATNALMSDRPLFGQRVWDVLRAVDWLRGRIQNSVQIDKGRIGCVGRGAAGLLALFVAALDDSVQSTVVWEAPVSYKSMIVQQPGFPPSTYLFDVLNHFDLPQLMAMVAPRSLLLASPVDGSRGSLPAGRVAEALEWPRRVYSAHPDASDQLCVLDGNETHSAAEAIAGWLQRHL
jgi:hypothetical protein